jgi:hypothetical protein
MPDGVQAWDPGGTYLKSQTERGSVVPYPAVWFVAEAVRNAVEDKNGVGNGTVEVAKVDAIGLRVNDAGVAYEKVCYPACVYSGVLCSGTTSGFCY